MPEHKHLIIRATVYEPITSEKELKKWLRDLVKIIDMKIIKGPYAAYGSKEGNGVPKFFTLADVERKLGGLGEY